MYVSASHAIYAGVPQFHDIEEAGTAPEDEKHGVVDEAPKVAKGDEAESAAVRAAAVGRNARRGRVRDDTAHAGGAQEGHQVSSLPRPCSSGDRSM